MKRDPKQIVAGGYDRITKAYLRLVESMGPHVREKYLRALAESAPAGGRVLELGCGAGTPMTQALSARFRTIGLDISPNQLALARQYAPLASLLRGDMVRLPFRDRSFDAVAAFYSMTHVPRAEHASLLAGIARVLRPGGHAVLTMGSADNPDGIDEDWLGAPMFFSHFDGDRNVALVREAGFEIVSAEDERELEYGIPVSFRWVVARLPEAAG
ncbi:MAG: class I SAM-dependent methyltransferase [Vicinamibacterales bacterium]